jgi:hypothetical protein
MRHDGPRGDTERAAVDLLLLRATLGRALVETA